LQGIGQFKKT